MTDKTEAIVNNTTDKLELKKQQFEQKVKRLEKLLLEKNLELEYIELAIESILVTIRPTTEQTTDEPELVELNDAKIAETEEMVENGK